jgi:hypothetical protein
MEYRVVDQYGHLLGTVFIPWDEQWIVKRTILCSFTWKEVVIF